MIVIHRSWSTTRIWQTVEDSKLKTAKEYWLALESIHARSTLSNKVMLLKRICRITLTESGNMENHITELMDLVDRLTGLGGNLDEDMIIAIMLGSLPDSYATLIMALEARPEHDLTIEMVKEKLIQESNRRLINTEDNEQQKVLKTAQNLKMYSNTIKCYGCGKLGHIKRNCRFAQMESQQKANIVAENEKPEKVTCFMVSNQPKSDDWYVDSAATCHMTNDVNFFKNIDMNKNNEVYQADGSVLKSKGIGNGNLECIIGGTKKIMYLKDVLLIPELDGNLISVQKLCKEGFKTTFEGNLCQIMRNGSVYSEATLTQKRLYTLNVFNRGYIICEKTRLHTCMA